MNHQATAAHAPRVTVIFLSYNHERFVGEAVRALLSQTRPPDEIILSDDQSSDRSFEIIQSEVKGYTGPAKLIVNRNPANLGLIGHVNHLMSLATGDLIMIATGDDVSYPNRVEQTLTDWMDRERPPLIFYDLELLFTPPAAHPVKFKPFNRETLEPCAILRGVQPTVLAPSMAWSKEVFGRFGPLPPFVPTEDKNIMFRALLLGQVVFIPSTLVKYRVHGGNMSVKDRSRDTRSKKQKRHNNLRIAEQRLEGYAHDLATACAKGLLDETQAKVLILAQNRARYYLYHRRRMVLGSLWERLSSRLVVSVLKVLGWGSPT